MNPFRHLLKSAGPGTPLGTWIMSASPLVAEAVGHAGFEWGVIDMEHTPLDLMDVVHLLQAVGNTRMVPVVRVPWNDTVTVKRVLDAGAQTVLFPFVQDADEARRAVAATRYPPDGVRGMAGMSRASRFGTTPDYLHTANRQQGVILQLETPQALDRLDEIAAVPGVDALFIGPADLSATMGFPGQLMHPQVVARMTAAAQRCRTLGMPMGTLGLNPDEVVRYRAAGFSYVAVGSDLGLLMRGATSAVRELRQQPGGAGHVHTLSGGTQTEGSPR
jgi:2-keto-3-deoxy-L-rhamnonate aldolase RhmA